MHEPVSGRQILQAPPLGVCPIGLVRLVRFSGLACLACCALAAWQCAGAAKTARPARRSEQRVFVIGFDGMDPALARKWMDAGKLPNLKRLAAEGTFSTLGSTQPSGSPPAWPSFATGANPGKHTCY